MFDPPSLEDYRAFYDACGFAVMDRTQIRVTGADRVTILHNLCTNDINRLSVGEGCEAVFPNVQGKAVGYGYVFVGEDALHLDTSAGWGEKLVEHFDRYVIMEDAEFTDVSSEFGELVVAGPEAADVIRGCTGIEVSAADETATARIYCLAGADVSVRRVPWMNVPCFFLSAPQAGVAGLREALIQNGARECSEAAAHCCRIEAGVPEYGLDVSESNLPQELDRNDVAISFQKGCYLGQETVARIDALGQVNWLLRRLSIDGRQTPESGAAIEVEGKEVARIRSAILSPATESVVCLAFVRHGHEAGGNQLGSLWGRATIVGET